MESKPLVDRAPLDKMNAGMKVEIDSQTVRVIARLGMLDHSRRGFQTSQRQVRDCDRG